MRTWSQPSVGRLAGEAVARHGRHHQVERVLGAPAVSRRIGQRIDDLELLDDRAGPAVRDDQRQRIFVLRADVDEVDVQPVDLGDELRQGLELRLELAPVVLGRPVARERLHRRQLHALRPIIDGLLARASASRRGAGGGRRGPPADLDAEGADGGRGGVLRGVAGRWSWSWWSPLRMSSRRARHAQVGGKHRHGRTARSGGASG